MPKPERAYRPHPTRASAKGRLLLATTSLAVLLAVPLGTAITEADALSRSTTNWSTAPPKLKPETHSPSVLAKVHASAPVPRNDVGTLVATASPSLHDKDLPEPKLLPDQKSDTARETSTDQRDQATAIDSDLPSRDRDLEMLAQYRTRTSQLEPKPQGRPIAAEPKPDPPQEAIAGTAPPRPASSTPDSPAALPQVPGDLELPQVIERGRALIREGDIGGARNVLEYAAAHGNPQALRLLAETYDPTQLSAWGALGTLSDSAKAKDLYARAAAAGAGAISPSTRLLP